jgi:hypothetical protein
MGSFMIGFITGSFFGVYVAQNYNVMSINNILTHFKEKLKEYEKAQKEAK